MEWAWTRARPKMVPFTWAPGNSPAIQVLRTTARLPWVGQQEAKRTEEEDFSGWVEFPIVTKVWGRESAVRCRG